MPNDAEHLKRWVTNAPANKPGAIMIAMSMLPPTQIDAIVAYLQTLK